MEENSLQFIAVISIIGLALFAFLYMSSNKRAKTLEHEKKTAESKIEELKRKFGPVVDLDAETERVRLELSELKEKYERSRPLLSDLEKQIELYQDNLDFYDFGLYEPQFSFDTSAKYQEALKENRNKQKQLIKDEKAITCSTDWAVGGSRQKGQKMVREGQRLMLRAFNGECDAAIARVKWNNETKMEERIKKAFQAVNKLGESKQIRLEPIYLSCKIEELRLTYEHEKKKQEEKEEQLEIRRQMREEEQAQRELEKAQKDAEAEEARSARALEKARLELQNATAEEIGILESKIALLEASLAEAHEKKERAISRAQQTRSGHVYVISNLGSFGESVYKIGMTRRLEPLDRVKELSDASVPFHFDVHAVIYSDDAPTLENTLHHKFHDRRLNLVNYRKEFFTVHLDEIERVVKEHHGEIEFTKIAEAEDFRKSEAMRNKKVAANSSADVEAKFPAELLI